VTATFVKKNDNGHLTFFEVETLFVLWEKENYDNLTMTHFQFYFRLYTAPPRYFALKTRLGKPRNWFW